MGSHQVIAAGLSLLLATMGSLSPLAAIAAEDPAVRDLLLEELADENIAPNTQIRVTGKYKELLDGDLILYGTSTRFLLRAPDLKRRVLEFTAKRDNLKVEGQLLLEEGERAVEVLEIQAAPDDPGLFSDEADKLRQLAAIPPNVASGLLDRALSAYELMEQVKLLPVIRQIFELRLGDSSRRLEPAETKKWVKFLAELPPGSGDMELTLSLANVLLARSQAPAPVEELLRSRGCRRHGGTWYSHAAYKQKEGLVEHEGRWITPREKSLLDTIERLKINSPEDQILRRRTEPEYRVLAEKGTIEAGMKPEEVALGLGFPDRVERRSFGGKELDQWCYTERICYFYNGVLLAK